MNTQMRATTLGTITWTRGPDTDAQRPECTVAPGFLAAATHRKQSPEWAGRRAGRLGRRCARFLESEVPTGGRENPPRASLTPSHLAMCAKKAGPGHFASGPLLSAVCFLLACLRASYISSRFPSWVSSTLGGANPLRAQNPSGPSTLLLQDSEARGTDANMLMLTLGAVGA